MREEIGYFIIVIMLAAVATLVWYTRRYVRAEARRFRGHYEKPVRKPFWMP